MMRRYRLLIFMLGLLLALGCDSLTDADPLHRAGLQVAPGVLDTYAGTYRLPSGALFPVVRDGEQLKGGTPPQDLLARTTREFRSNLFPGEFHFERSAPNGPMSLRWRLGKRDVHCDRVDRNVESDPTIRVSAGIHQLRMLIAGRGGPAIVVEDGFGNGIDHQSELQADLAKFTTAVTYDHAGTGGSDPGPSPRDARRVVQELRLALRNAGVPPPFLLMGSSIGGDYIRVFAYEYPAETAGLVLLDPTPDFDRFAAWADVHSPRRAGSYRRFVRDANNLMTRFLNVLEQGRAAEWAALETTRAQARRAFPLPAVPIVQITGSSGQQTSTETSDKVRFFDAWLKEHLPTAKHVLAPHSGHAVAITDRTLVLDEVRRMVSALRAAASPR